MYRVRPFLHPISRCIYLNRCRPTVYRTLSTTRPVSRISKKDALAGLEMFDELVETGKLTTNTEMGKLATDPKSVAGVDTVKTTSEDISEDDPEEDEEEDSDYDLLDILA